MADSFSAEIYRLAGQIPAGRVCTYGTLAMLAGRPGAGRTVGWLMSRAPEGLPAHRVLNRRGEMSPPEVFGEGVQRSLLEAEGITFGLDGRVDIKAHLWEGEE